MSTNPITPKAGAAKPEPKKVTFIRASEQPKKRMILSVEGLQKEGKTHFCMSAPEPICIHNFDFGLEGVIHKFAHKELYEFKYRLPAPLKIPGAPERSVGDLAKEVMEEFVTNYRASLEQMRTVVIDTGTEAWELFRLASLGRLTEILPMQYAAVNAKFRELLRLGADYEVNVILIHKVKSEYLNDRATGKFVRAGFGDIGFAVQDSVKIYKDPKEKDPIQKFKLQVMESRHRESAAGTILSGEDVNFATLGNLLIPEFSVEEWGK